MILSFFVYSQPISLVTHPLMGDPRSPISGLPVLDLLDSRYVLLYFWLNCY
jgi:hypothetical protein